MFKRQMFKQFGGGRDDDRKCLKKRLNKFKHMFKHV